MSSSRAYLNHSGEQTIHTLQKDVQVNTSRESWKRYHLARAKNLQDEVATTYDVLPRNLRAIVGIPGEVQLIKSCCSQAVSGATCKKNHASWEHFLQQPEDMDSLKPKLPRPRPAVRISWSSGEYLGA